MPALGQKYQFKLPNTKAGDKHKLLQHKLASLLDIGDVEYEFFLTEAISIIIPIIIPFNILPHRDKLNDGKNTKSGTVTLNCTLPISIITNKKVLELVKLLRNSTTFPSSIIFHSMEKLNEIEQGSKLKQAIVSCVQKTNVVYPRDYIGQLFNSSNGPYDSIFAKPVETTPSW